MKILISSNANENVNIKQFTILCIQPKLKQYIALNADQKILDKFSEEFKVDYVQFFNFVLSNLYCSKVGNNNWVIGINNNLKFKNKDVSYYINAITYGTRTMHCYPILKSAFSHIVNNISQIYEDYKNGNTVL